jgi:hypothetical protein
MVDSMISSCHGGYKILVNIYINKKIIKEYIYNVDQEHTFCSFFFIFLLKMQTLSNLRQTGSYCLHKEDKDEVLLLAC